MSPNFNAIPPEHPEREHGIDKLELGKRALRAAILALTASALISIAAKQNKVAGTSIDSVAPKTETVSGDGLQQLGVTPDLTDPIVTEYASPENHLKPGESAVINGFSGEQKHSPEARDTYENMTGDHADLISSGNENTTDTFNPAEFNSGYENTLGQ